jgi:hypothetical protein
MAEIPEAKRQALSLKFAEWKALRHSSADEPHLATNRGVSSYFQSSVHWFGIRVKIIHTSENTFPYYLTSLDT